MGIPFIYVKHIGVHAILRWTETARLVGKFAASNRR